MQDLWVSYQIYFHGPESPELEFFNILWGLGTELE